MESKENTNRNVLNILNAQISLNKSYTIYQTQEILKAECSLLQLKNHLILQKKDLTAYIDEVRELEEEIIQRISKPDVINKPGIDSYVSDREPDFNELKRNEISLNTEIDIDIMETTECDTNKLIEKSFSQSNSKPFKVKAQFSQLEFPQLKDKIIHYIHYKDDCMYIGGSNGLLLRYSNGVINAFETDPDDCILQIYTMKHDVNTWVLCRTYGKIIVFLNFVSIKRFVGVPEIRHIYNNGQSLYITLKDGTMRMLNRQTFALDKKKLRKFKHISCYLPSNGFSILSRDDSKLYKVNGNDFNSRKIICGITNVKDIFLMHTFGYVCYSDTTLWLLGHDFNIIDTHVFHCGIRLFSYSYLSVAIVDFNNNINLFYCDKGISLRNLYEESIEGNVTAIRIYQEKLQVQVAVAINDAVFVMQYSL